MSPSKKELRRRAVEEHNRLHDARKQKDKAYLLFNYLLKLCGDRAMLKRKKATVGAVIGIAAAFAALPDPSWVCKPSRNYRNSKGWKNG